MGFVLIKFGTGGWRAVIGSDFTEANIRLVARGLYSYAKEFNKLDKDIVIGYDNRFLSNIAAEWFANELSKCGMNILLLDGSVPTPLVMHMVQDNELFYGAAITASHNPLEYNGIKLFVEEGRDAPIEFTNHLENIIESLETAEWTYTETPGSVNVVSNPYNSFIDKISHVIDLQAIQQSNMKILFDPMHGSGRYPLEVILHQARCHVDVINGQKDGFFGNLTPAPSQYTLRELIAKVTTHDYNLGIALDGDGDRLGIVDADGKYISANQILVLLYWYLHEYKHWKGPVIRNLATTHMLDVLAQDLGEECIEVPVGFKHISSGIDKYDAVLGGESSGGLTVRGHIHGKDSIYAASLFVEMLAVTQKTAGELYASLKNKYGSFEMVECNMKFDENKKALYQDAVFAKKMLPGFANAIKRISYEDGCKIYFTDNSWVICRFSGTEPVLRIFAEASTKGIAQSYIDCFVLFFDNLHNVDDEIDTKNYYDDVTVSPLIDMASLQSTLNQCWISIDIAKPESVINTKSNESIQCIDVLAKDNQGHIGMRKRMKFNDTTNVFFKRDIDITEWHWSDADWTPTYWMPVPR